MLRMVLALGIFVFSANVFAAIEHKPSTFVLCKNQKNVRTIRIHADKSQAQTNCTITYTKGGVDEVVGSNRSLGTCQSILKNIQSNLESSKWSCRSVQAAVVSSSAVTR